MRMSETITTKPPSKKTPDNANRCVRSIRRVQISGNGSTRMIALVTVFTMPVLMKNAFRLMHFPGPNVHRAWIGQHWKISTKTTAMNSIETRVAAAQSAILKDRVLKIRE